MPSVFHNCHYNRRGLKNERWLAILLMASLILTQPAAFPALAEEGSEATVSTETPPPPPSDPSPPAPSQSSPSVDATSDNGVNDASPETTQQPITTSNDQTATIETGDATSEIDITNAVNTNATSLVGSNDSGDSEAGGSSAAEPAPVTENEPNTIAEPPPPAQDPPPRGITPAQATSTDSTSINADISNTNAAEVSNDAAGLAVSGLNAASTTEGGIAITTGDVFAGANVTNLVNTNAVGSQLALVAINQASSTATIDLRPEFSTSTQTSLFDPAASTTLRVTNENAATTTNDITLVARSGANDAATQCGDAAIRTGDAAAGANVINFVNTNFVGSRLAVVAVNQLGDWFGDLILPGQTFFTSFFGSQIYSTSSDAGGPIPPPLEATIVNVNRASVANDITLRAVSGSNSALGSAGTEINTGTSSAMANIANFVNTNVFNPGGSRLSVLINVGGRWDGAAYSLPPAVRLENRGGRLVAEYGSGIASALTAASSQPYELPDRLHVQNTNTAAIENNIHVLASSGGNAAVAGCGEAEIATGSAAAAANVINFANTNVIGTNWFLALVNIAGNWAGNLSFGQPDLWLGQTASLSSPEPIGLGYTITYTLTVLNRGDADATGVYLKDVFDHRYLSSGDSGGGSLGEDGIISWNIGTVPANGSASRSYTVAVTDKLPQGDIQLINSSIVVGLEPDGNPADNSDSLSIWAKNLTNGRPGGTWPPELVIAKTNDTTGPITASSTVHYRITVTNNGTGLAYHTVVVDNVQSPNGNILKSFTWKIGELLPRKQAIIDYEVLFASSSPPGIYKNLAYAQALGGGQAGYLVFSPVASSTIEILGAGGNGTSTGLSAAKIASNPTYTITLSPVNAPVAAKAKKPHKIAEKIADLVIPQAAAAPLSFGADKNAPKPRTLAAIFAGFAQAGNNLAIVIISILLALFMNKYLNRRKNV